MVAYLKQMPPEDNELPETTVGLISRILVLIEPTMLPAQQIEHDHGSLSSPEPGVNAEYGRYLATACSVCHKPDFSGGEYLFFLGEIVNQPLNRGCRQGKNGLVLRGSNRKIDGPGSGNRHPLAPPEGR